jgi:hypothetical protein
MVTKNVKKVNSLALKRQKLKVLASEEDSKKHLHLEMTFSNGDFALKSNQIASNWIKRDQIGSSRI